MEATVRTRWSREVIVAAGVEGGILAGICVGRGDAFVERWNGGCDIVTGHRAASGMRGCKTSYW